MAKIVRFFYNIFFSLALPLLFIRLLWRSRLMPQYRKRWLERLGIFSSPDKKGGIWVHTVSVGEAMAAMPVIRELQEKYQHELITVTTTTITGSERVKASLGDSVFHVYLPYDISWAVQGFLQRVQPKMCVILETELWPNLLHCCQQRKIPVLIINGRLSDQSMQGYKRLGFIVKDMLSKITQVAVQSAMDGDRFVKLGLTKEQLLVAGNIKYDVPINEHHTKLGQELRNSWGERLVWIAASTHNEEEEQVLTAFAVVKKKIPNALLVLVPRHPERFDMVAGLIASHNFTVARRSMRQVCGAGVDVFLGDTMGEMGIFYQTADVAFVAGSFVPIGGHNMLEPAALGIPVISGPHLHNFVEISQKMLAANAMVVVNDPQALAEVVICWLQSKETREKFGNNAFAVVQANQGATKRVLAAINNTWSKTTAKVNIEGII